MTKQLLSCVTCVAVLMSAPAISMAQSREAESLVTVLGTVEAVDHRPHGDDSVAAGQPGDPGRPAKCHAVQKVKVGDTVTATYYDRVSLRLKPAGEPAVDRTVEPTTTATPGDTAGCHDNQAAGDDRDHHRLVPCRQGRELHRTERDGLLARTAGHHRSQDHRGTQGG